MNSAPSHRLKALAGLGLATLTLLLACDDQNLFEAREVARPQIISLSVPPEVQAGQTLDVRVRAVGELRIDSLVVTARGSFSADETVLLERPLNDATADVSFEVPSVIQDTVLTITATAVDVAGNLSAQASQTIRVRDGTAPSVTVQASRQVVGLGQEVGIRVQAQDNVGLRNFGFRLIQVFRDSLTAEVISEDTLTTELVTVTGSTRDSTFLAVIPQGIPEGDVRVEGIAEDLDGNVTVQAATASLQVVFIDDVLPTAVLVTPRDGATLPVGDSLFVEVNLMDNGGISRVTLEGVALRGDPDLGTDEVVQRFEPKTVTFDSPPQDTVLTRFLRPVADSTSEEVLIIATAVDGQGNEAADTSAMIVGGPRVELLNVEDGQEILSGRSLSIRIRSQDPQQLLSVQLEVSGAIDTVMTRAFAPPVDSATVDTTLVIPAGLTGSLSFLASARNTLDVRGESSPATLTIIEESGADDIMPEGSITASAPSRMELQDVVGVELTGRDDTQGSGVVRAGYTVLAISPTRGDTLVRTDERSFSPPRTGNVSQGFTFPPFNVDLLALPDTLNFEITGYMVDDEGNCGAFVADTTGSLPCTTLTVAGQTVTVAEDFSGLRLTRPVVDGRTVFLPEGGTIADAVVDPVRPFLVLSNIDRDRLEIFELQTEEFGEAVLVGDDPWGLAFNRMDPDTLLVANSGGTNLSRVYMASADPQDASRGEAVNRRIKTPNDVLTTVSLQVGEDSREFIFRFDDFSDRPQFIAHDSVGRIVYSTMPTPTAPEGTIRMADQGPADDGTPYEATEVTLFFEYALPDALSPTEDTWSFARVDEVAVGVDPDTDVSGLFICDHPPGFPSQVQCTDPESEFPELLGSRMRALVPGSDAFSASGGWNVDQLALTDTTFVSASGDGGWVAFGEGASAPTGRIILWNAGQPSVSNGIPVQDLPNNQSDRVFGVALNNDGTLGAARGVDQVYTFTPDLRLQGSGDDLGSGASGIALHPLHSNASNATSLFYDPNTHLAFAGTGDGTIDIVDTFHFFRTGRVFIRDVVTGPLKAALPFPADNADLPAGSCDDLTPEGAIRLFDDANGNVINQSNSPQCVVLKLYGVTDSGGVVVIDVTKNDILRNHPASEN